MDSEQGRATATVECFGFQWLEERFAAVPVPQRERSGVWERRAWAVGLLAAGIAIVLGRFAPGRLGVWLVVACVVVELSALALACALTLRQQWPSFRHPIRDFAVELDFGFIHYQRLVTALRYFPADELDMHLRYLRARRASLQLGMRAFTGGLERLGMLPALGVLYLQFRDWRWGDWARLAEVNLVQALLIGALLVAYVAGWQLMSLHRRIAAYEALLAEALHAPGAAPVPLAPPMEHVPVRPERQDSDRQ